MGIAKSRGRVALLMIITLILCLRFDVLRLTLLPALTALLGAMGIREFHRMARLQNANFSLPLALVLGAGIIICGIMPPDQYASLFPVLITFSMILLFSVQMNRFGIPGAVTGAASAGFSLLYIAVPLSLALQVTVIDRLFLFFALLLIWMADSGAYFVGRKFGRHKLAPNLSPKKTVEGLIGGILTCGLVAVLFKHLVPSAAFHQFPSNHVLVLGAIIGVMAPLGDLAESVLKRDAGVKDSGTGLGGHGGVLDRVDSMLFCMPLYYAYLRYFAEAGPGLP